MIINWWEEIVSKLDSALFFFDIQAYRRPKIRPARGDVAEHHTMVFASSIAASSASERLAKKKQTLICDDNSALIVKTGSPLPLSIFHFPASSISRVVNVQCAPTSSNWTRDTLIRTGMQQAP